jgi:hypothetical protein
MLNELKWPVTIWVMAVVMMVVGFGLIGLGPNWYPAARSPENFAASLGN